MSEDQSLVAIAARHFKARQDKRNVQAAQDRRDQLSEFLPSMRVIDALLETSAVEIAKDSDQDLITFQEGPMVLFYIFKNLRPEEITKGLDDEEIEARRYFYFKWHGGLDDAYELGRTAEEFDRNLLNHISELVQPGAEKTFVTALDL